MFFFGEGLQGRKDYGKGKDVFFGEDYKIDYQKV